LNYPSNVKPRSKSKIVAKLFITAQACGLTASTKVRSISFGSTACAARRGAAAQTIEENDTREIPAATTRDNPALVLPKIALPGRFDADAAPRGFLF
jgi:hypothetical protein